jgi:hypothetical protein
VFNFSKSIPVAPKKPKAESAKVEALYGDEKDPICQLVKKILYAEGDFIS